MEEYPKYLYHYTSIRNLALILKSKKIRLSSLDCVDDVSESTSQDVVNYGKYFFVSCWTSLEEESIPFWHMYTPDMQGVRIKMPLNMFKKHPIKSLPEYGAKAEGEGYFVTPVEELFLKDYKVFPDVPNKFYPVEYTNSPDLLHPRLFELHEDGSKSVRFGRLGKYKSIHWAFQSEWRLRLLIIPGIPLPKDLMENKKSMDRYVAESAAFVTGKELGFNEYFLELDECAFEDMEIMLGPKQNSGDKIIVDSLVKEFNPTAKVMDSVFKGKIQ